MTQTTFERVRDILSSGLFVFDIAPAEITPATTLDDLAFDSLDRVELTMTAEETFRIELDDEAAQDARTVGDLVALIDRAVADRAGRAA